MTVFFKHAHPCATACWQAVRNPRLTSICDANEKPAQSDQTSVQLEEVFRIENKVTVKSVDFCSTGP